MFLSVSKNQKLQKFFFDSAKESGNSLIESNFLHGVNVFIGSHDKDIFSESYGYADDLHNHEMTLDKVFDLASLTKAVGTALIAAHLRDKSKLDYNQSIRRYLPNIPIENFPYGEPTVKDLLIHYSGIDSFRYYDKYMLKGHDELYQSFVYNLTGISPIGQIYEYNCGNYILLGLIVEEITKMPLNKVAQKYLFNKLQLKDTFWGIPLIHTLENIVSPKLVTTHGSTPKELVPNEILNLHLKDCLPSDETARWVLPYCIGNAGMFSTIEDLSKIARFILSRPFDNSTMELLTTNQAPFNLHPRSCGFDLEEESVFSKKTIHHTGWSGQSIWIDLDKNIFAIVLTCRSNTLDGQRKARLKIVEIVLKDVYLH